MRLLMLTTTLLLLTGCGEEPIVHAPCAYVEPLAKVPIERIVPNKDGTLGYYNTLKAKRQNDRLRIVEDYYFTNTTEVKEYNEAH